MKRVWIAATLIAGCAPYISAEQALVDQARKGITLLEQAEEVRQKQSIAIANERRTRLDAAFDADVHDQKSLDPDWVIEQRRAYSTAKDALARQVASDKQLAATTEQNLSDIDRALQQLELMIDVQDKVVDLKPLIQQEAK